MTTGRQVGRWRLIDYLGEGSTGDVYSATDGERTGAVKIVRPIRPIQPAELEAAWARLGARLGRIAAVEDPGVIDVWDWGLDRADAELWYVMERLSGTSLAMEPQHTVSELVRIGVRLANALAALHAKGEVHGDIKPQNLFWEPDGRAVIVDFSLAILDEQLGTPTGSPRWMAPECLHGAPGSPAADVYALCQVLGELAVGGPLFTTKARGPSALIELTQAKDAVESADPGPGSGILRKIVVAGTRRRAGDRPTARELSRLMRELTLQ